MTEERKPKIDRFNVDKKDFNDFNRLKEKDTPFAGATNKEIFLAAMVVGYHEGCRIEIKSKEGYFHEKDLTKEEAALIRAIAVAEEGGLNVLLDKQEIYSIAEQYATGGISLLKAKVLSGEYGSYAKKLESELLRKFKENVESQAKPQTLEEIIDLSINDLISQGESNSVEFKSSLIWDYKKQQSSKLMGMIVARTISSFMNSEGGILLIGVDNNRKMLGLDKDLAQTKGNKDDFELHFTNTMNSYLGKINRPLINLKFGEIEGKEVAVVVVKKSPRPVYLKYEGKTEFFIRSGNSSQPLDISEATDYIKDQWPDLR